MLARFKRVAGVMAFLLCAAAALAQSTPITNSHDATVDNQVTVNSCSVGEPVALNGTVHVESSVTTDSAGINHFQVTAASSLTGTGQNTGTSYSASDSDQYSSNNDDASADLMVELKSDLKSQGSSPSLTLVQTLHITTDSSGNLGVQVVGSTTNCGS